MLAARPPTKNISNPLLSQLFFVNRLLKLPMAKSETATITADWTNMSPQLKINGKSGKR